MLVSNESNFLIFSCIVFLFWGYEFQPFRAATNSCQNCEFFGASKTPSPLPRLEKLPKEGNVSIQHPNVNDGMAFPRVENPATVRFRGGGLPGLARGWKREVQQVGSLTVDCGHPLSSVVFHGNSASPLKGAHTELPGDDILFLQIHSVRVFFKFAMMNKNIVLYKEFFSSRMWLPFIHVNLWFWRTFVAAHMGSELPTTDHWGVYWRAAGRLDISGLDILL